MQKKTVRFSAHFEKTDAAQVKFDHVAAQGVCAVEPRVDSFVGEFTNYSSDNPVSVNKELTYGSASETEKAFDRRTYCHKALRGEYAWTAAGNYIPIQRRNSASGLLFDRRRGRYAVSGACAVSMETVWHK